MRLRNDLDIWRADSKIRLLFYLFISFVSLFGWRRRSKVSEIRNFKNFILSSFFRDALLKNTPLPHSGSLYEIKIETLQNK